jgi:hypothetical protein
MEYKTFLNLIGSGEKTNVDFKLECNAFKTKNMQPKAELAKDICAMANNGNRTSYIIIGVSDNGRNFKSVNNDKLTDDKIQDFCKKAIYPPPAVKLICRRWKNIRTNHSDKTFVIIQIGPHARSAYRLNQDFIDYKKEEVCFRRNEVWVRRGATSDLATPEEISRLVQKLPIEDFAKPSENNIYSQFSKDYNLVMLSQDLKRCIREAGGIIKNERVVLKIKNSKIVLRPILVRGCGEKRGIWLEASHKWAYEHGILIVSLEPISKQAFHPAFKINFNNNWGWFSIFEIPNYYYPEIRIKIPTNVNSAFPFILTLPRIKDSITLHQSFHRMLDFLDSNDHIFEQINDSKKQMNANLRVWLKEGWIVETNHIYSAGKPEKLEKDEIFDERRYGGRVMRRVQDISLRQNAKTILSLSK